MKLNFEGDHTVIMMYNNNSDFSNNFSSVNESCCVELV